MPALDTALEHNNAEITVKRSLRSGFFSIQECSALTKIAMPLILASLVTMSISITDVIMIGKLGTLELAAGAAASDFYSILFYLAAGVAAAIAPLVAQARGKRYFRDIKTICLQGFIASMIFGIPASVAVFNAPFFLELIHVQADIVGTAKPYAHMMAIALFPMLAMSVLHYFLSANNHTKVIFMVTAFALPVNIVGNYLLLYGNLGAPKLGLAGAGIATTMTGLFMVSALSLYIIRHPSLRRYLFFPVLREKNKHFRHEILKVGLPIGVSHFGEMGVFLFSTVTMGIFGAEILAAHTVALRVAGIVYAAPLGYAQAATVRIGYLMGQGNRDQIHLAVRTALTLAGIIGCLMLLLIVATKDDIANLFLNSQQINPIITVQASAFLFILAFIQPTDCFGTIGAGVLRGFKDTQKPMVFSLGSYWGFGFVGALILAFVIDLGGIGLWIGLLTATTSFALFVLLRIYKTLLN